MMAQVQPGQKASIDTGHGVIQGKVALVSRDGAVVSLDEPLPGSVRPGLTVDGTIHIGTLSGVAYVGRPVRCHLNGGDTIFKLAPDGRSATQVKVHYGKGSINLVEVRSGLQAGDKVILSDMSAYQGQDRVQIE